MAQYDQEVVHQLVLQLGADKNLCIQASKLVQDPGDINQVIDMYNILEQQSQSSFEEKKQKHQKSQPSVDQFTVEVRRGLSHHDEDVVNQLVKLDADSLYILLKNGDEFDRK